MVVHIHTKPGQAVEKNKRGNTQGTKAAAASEQPQEAVFDIGKERNKGNQFWKQGKGREEHRALELAAKQRRLAKAAKNHGIAKVQILEEPLSDEVSPGVTCTTSPHISPKSSGPGDGNNENGKTASSPTEQKNGGENMSL